MYTSRQIPSGQVTNIFVDLDETLIHTNLYPREPNEVPQITVNISPLKHAKENYEVSLRPGGNDLLFALRSIGNVFMLTRATYDYAVAMNKAFNFAFPENTIYSRKYVEDYRYKELALPRGINFLIDDLLQRDNYEKVSLISQLGPVHYIRILPFYGFKNEALTTGMIAEIVNAIKEK